MKKRYPRVFQTHHKRKPPPREIARESQDQQHDRPGNVRRHGIQIRLHDAVAQAGDDLRQEQLHALQRHAETDLDRQNQVAGPVLENPETVPQVEFLVHDRAGVDLHAVVGEVFFGLGEEARGGGGLRQVGEGEEGEEDGAAAFDDEEVAPVGERAGVDLEDAEGEQAGEGGGDGLGGVEDGESARQFAAAVEAGGYGMLVELLEGQRQRW